MTNEQLDKIKANIELKILIEKNTGFNEYTDILKEEIQLYNEVVRLKNENENILDKLKELEDGDNNVRR